MLKHRNSLQKSLCPVVMCPYLCGSEKVGFALGRPPRRGRSKRALPLRLRTACAAASFPRLGSHDIDSTYIPKFPRGDSKRKRRLRENRAITHIKDKHPHGIALFSLSLFLGLESPLDNLRGIERIDIVTSESWTLRGRVHQIEDEADSGSCCIFPLASGFHFGDCQREENTRVD